MDLNERLSAYLDALEQSSKAVGDFAKEQLPMVAQEYINWVFYSSLGGTLGGVLLAILSIILWLIFMRLWKNDEDSPMVIVIFVAATLTIMAGAVTFSVSLPKLVKVTVAPRIVLIEKIAELRK